MLKEHKKEIQRWLYDKKEPKMWVKDKFVNNGEWFKVEFEDCSWDKECYYIVDDKCAELRKLQIDEPNTKIEYYSERLNRWFETTCPEWDINTKYRVKQDPIFKVSNKGTNKEFIVRFTGLKTGKVVFAMPDSPHKIGYESDRWCNHNEEDCWKDVSYNPKRDLYDKQPIICWGNNMETVKIIGFYDIENDGVFNKEGYRDGFEYENYAPYPHPDDEFIIEMYIELED